MSQGNNNQRNIDEIIRRYTTN